MIIHVAMDWLAEKIIRLDKRKVNRYDNHKRIYCSSYINLFNVLISGFTFDQFLIKSSMIFIDQFQINVSYFEHRSRMRRYEWN